MGCKGNGIHRDKPVGGERTKRMFVYVKTEVSEDIVGVGGAGVHDVGMEGAEPNWKGSVGSEDRGRGWKLPFRAIFQ